MVGAAGAEKLVVGPARAGRQVAGAEMPMVGAEKAGRLVVGAEKAEVLVVVAEKAGRLVECHGGVEGPVVRGGGAGGLGAGREAWRG